MSELEAQLINCLAAYRTIKNLVDYYEEMAGQGYEFDDYERGLFWAYKHVLRTLEAMPPPEKNR